MLKPKSIQASDVLLSLIIILLLIIVSQLELFGDESFYWLEGKFLDWSYSELPGWTAWIIGLSTHLFGDNNFAVRLPGFIGFFSACYALFRVSQAYNSKIKFSNLTLLLLAIPLFLLISIMALPDVWLIFCVAWICYFLAKLNKQQKLSHYILLGGFIAIAINVHIRMWIWLFIAALSWLFVYRVNLKQNYKLFTISLPIGLLGLIPILIFNVEHNFPLFQFQIHERQPWEFQIKNLSLALSQLLVVSPLIFYLWIKSTISFSKSKYLKWLQITALCHFIFYIVVGVFADGVRANFHWLAISYFPIIAILLTQKNISSKLIKLSVIIGYLFSLVFAIYILNSKSHLSSKIIQNSSDWKALNQEVLIQMNSLGTDAIIADHFMTASQLAYLQSRTENIKVLNHKLNLKHGRQKQLEINGLLIPENSKIKYKAILIVESSAIKLSEQGKYWENICHQFDSLKLVRTINNIRSKKQYYIFEANNSANCEKPPIIYLEHTHINDVIKITGWALWDNQYINKFSIKDSQQSKPMISGEPIKAPSLLKLYPNISNLNQNNNGFEFELPNSVQLIQLRIENGSGKTQFSKYYYLD